MAEKKRSTYKRGAAGDLPGHVDKSKYYYRWLNANKVAQNSDYYDPRGYELDKNADGKTTVREDRILGRMPIDLYEAMKEEKEEARKSQLQLVLESQAAQEERDSHEFKKKGGKIKFEFTQE
jgi:hypothetical protein